MFLLFYYRYYPSAETCATDAPSGLYGWYGLGTCIPTTTDEGVPMSMAFSQCANGFYTMSQFSDSACSQFVQAITTPLQHCVESEDGSDDDDSFSVAKNYESFTCTTA